METFPARSERVAAIDERSESYCASFEEEIKRLEPRMQVASRV